MRVSTGMVGLTCKMGVAGRMENAEKGRVRKEGLEKHGGGGMGRAGSMGKPGRIGLDMKDGKKGGKDGIDAKDGKSRKVG